MKLYILISVLFLTISCSKEEQQENEMELNITKAEWHTATSGNGFAEIYLYIEGNTNSELLTIETYGDGVVGCKEIQLDQNNNFSEEIMIAFSPNWDTIPNKYSTRAIAYEKSDPPDIPVFCITGTGKQVIEKIESDYLRGSL